MTTFCIGDEKAPVFGGLPSLIRSQASWFLTFVLVISLAGSLSKNAAADDSNWIRPERADAPLIWGRKDGILFGLPSEGGLPGPRGLIRLGVMSSETGRPQLLNFIAVEPVISGDGSRFSRMGFSELELSTLDSGKRGKRLWVEPPSDYRGTLTTIHSSKTTIQRLEVRIDVERFTANGAHVYVVASIESDHPNELKLQVYRENDSPTIEELTLTATMGNFERLRWLFLKDQTIESLHLFGTETGDGFFEHENYPVEEMLRMESGDAIALAASDEPNPSSELRVRSDFWHYTLPRYTQYWRVPAHDIEPDLRVRVNGRKDYWASQFPVPNGVAFENFELRQRYVAGQTFIFGATTTEPWEFNPPIPHLRRLDLSNRRSTQEMEKR